MATVFNQKYLGKNSKIYGGTYPIVIGDTVTSLALVNTSGTTQASNFVSPMFGLPFKQGQILAGDYPVFEVDGGSVCPSTLWGEVRWPDGSLKFVGAMIRVPSSIPGSGTLTVNVLSGGAAPAASSLTSSSLSASDLKIEITGVSSLTGVWESGLVDGFTDASDVVLIGSGGAGLVYRVGAEFKQSAAAHGQLYAWHYVAALQNESNGLLGVRHLATVFQPWIDVASPSPTTRTFTGKLKTGVTDIRTIQCVTAGEVIGNNITIDMYTGFATVGTSGKWDYVQGGGTGAADCTVRVIQDPDHMVKSRLIPPYDTTASVDEYTPWDYVPNTRAGMARSVGGGSERDEIGVLSAWAARHAINPSVGHDKQIRAVGLASLGWQTHLRNRASRNIPPATNPRASYTGLSAINSDMYYLNGNWNGVNEPVSNSTLWIESEETHHIASATYYPYLVTGEPQYLDALINQAAANIIHLNSSGRTYKTVSPISGSLEVTTGNFGTRDVNIQNGSSYKGGGILFISSGARIGAWQLRTLGQAASICPDNMPDGSQSNLYLKDILSNSLLAYNEYTNAMPAGHRTSGIHFLDGIGSTPTSPWMVGYVSSTLSHLSQISGLPEATLARQHLSRWIESCETVSCVQQLTSYRMGFLKENLIKVDDPKDVLYQTDNVTLSFSSATNRVTVGGSKPWTPSNGDSIAFPTQNEDGTARDSSNTCGALGNQRLWFVNVSGQTAELSFTEGGAPLTISGDDTVTVFNARFKVYPYPIMAGNITSSERLAAFLAYTRFHLACGDTNVTSALTSLQAAITSAGGITGYATDPKHLLSTYPE